MIFRREQPVIDDVTQRDDVAARQNTGSSMEPKLLQQKETDAKFLSCYLKQESLFSKLAKDVMRKLFVS